MLGRFGRSLAGGLALMVLVGTGCTDGGDGSPLAASARAAAADESSSAPTPSEAAVLEMERFETPSGNILCHSFETSLTCVIDSGLVPDPSHDFCPVDWIGLLIEVGQFAGPACSGDPGIERTAAPEFPYEATWSRNGVTCRSANSGLTCRDDEGNGFMLASAGWRILRKGAAARAAFADLRAAVRAAAHEEFGSELSSVDRPTLRGGNECGNLQQAFVTLTVSGSTQVVYEACFVSGQWYITDGPLYPD
jgi:hypothetical protein